MPLFGIETLMRRNMMLRALDFCNPCLKYRWPDSKRQGVAFAHARPEEA